jgi:hypothetical protein
MITAPDNRINSTSRSYFFQNPLLAATHVGLKAVAKEGKPTRSLSAPRTIADEPAI